MKSLTAFLFGRDLGMVVFLVFLVLVIIVVPMVYLSQPSRLALSAAFVLTLIVGAFATIRHRILTGLAVALAVAGLSADLIGELAPQHGFPELEAALKLACLSILVFMTVRIALRPGRVDAYRVIAGIAGYLLIGFTWTFAYQLVVNRSPDAIHFVTGSFNASMQQPSDLIYYSFITLCTVGYGDAYPVHPAVRSLAVAEALVGQLYLAILIASLVGMALQTKSVLESSSRPDSQGAFGLDDEKADASTLVTTDGHR
jgi:voltage-gated potassium channel